MILPDGKDLSAELVKVGLAWQYKKYSKDKQLADMEAKARKARVGLWVDAKPMPPLGVATIAEGQGQGRQAACRRFRRALVDQFVRRPAQLDLPLVSQEQGPAVRTE